MAERPADRASKQGAYTGIVLGTVGATIRRYAMMEAGSRAGVAVSGGADSVALLELLRELGRDAGWHLEVLHVDHGLRGAESDGDREFVQGLARRYELPCHVTRVEARALGGNLEQAARRVRYAYFEQIRRERQLDVVATGHTASDQAETVILRLLQGASPSSLAAVRAVRDGWIVRPLIEVTREEVRAWLTKRGSRWREDASNQVSEFARNRVRAELMPRLKEFNPRVERALAGCAAAAQEEERYWNEAVAQLWAGVAREHEQGLTVRLAGLRAVPAALAARFWRRACEQAAGAPVRLERDHIAALIALARGAAGRGRVSLPGLTAWRSFDEILIAPPAAWPGEAAEVRFRAPGEAELAAGIRVRAECVRAGQHAYNVDDGLVSAAAVDGDLVLRLWRAGDRYRPRGSRRQRTLHELFAARRIAAWARARWPVVEWCGQIVWSRQFGVNADFVDEPSSGGWIRLVEVPPQRG
jgi:tRNA(Ile)-lysidine synthase